MPDHNFNNDAAIAARIAELQAQVAEARAHAKSADRPEILTEDDILALPDRDYLLKGIMAPAEMSVWYGAPKCGKSFLLMHITRAISQGRGVFGRRVKPTRVLYIAGEGRSGLKGRLRALRKRFGPAPDFLFIARPLNLRSAADADWLREEVTRHGIGLVVVDTLSRNLAGGDENAPSDMTAFIGNLDMIRAETGAHVAVVHHCPQHADRPRGHGSLVGAADALIAVALDEAGIRTATVAGAKDDPADQQMAFRLTVEELGTDADGDPLTTCLVDELDPAAVPKPGRKPAKPVTASDVALELLERAVIDEGTPAPASRNIPSGVLVVPIATWRSYCDAGQIATSDTPEAKRQAFSRASRNLQFSKRIGVWKSLVWLANSPKRDNGCDTDFQSRNERPGNHRDMGRDTPPDGSDFDLSKPDISH
jgi:hypothetical protein